MKLHARESQPRPPRHAVLANRPMTEAEAQAWREKLGRIRQGVGLVPTDPFTQRATSDETSDKETDAETFDHTGNLH